MKACPSCGREASSETWPDGLCPSCLLSGVLEVDNGSDHTDGPAVADLSSGTNLGPFVIVELLGKGGMAAVFHAYETELDRDVALKVLPPEFLHDESFARRFEREAKLVAKLEHPDIVPIYASGIEAGIPWMSMRLMAGGSLDTVLKTQSLSVARIVEVLQGVAEALDHAHAAGVIHRDIKPSNIMLDDASHVCVGDFGLAKVAEQSLVHTQTAMAGTPHYMAPEQALGGVVDHRSDIYSLGIVAYEMLTGHVPFVADSPIAVLMKHVNQTIPIPSDQGANGPLWRVIERCVAKEPDERWRSASAFAAAMREAAKTAPPGSQLVLVEPKSSGSASSKTLRTDHGDIAPRRPGPLSRRALVWASAVVVSLATAAGVTLYRGDQSVTVVPPEAPASLDLPAQSGTTQGIPSAPDTLDESTSTDGEVEVSPPLEDESVDPPAASEEEAVEVATPSDSPESEPTVVDPGGRDDIEQPAGPLGLGATIEVERPSESSVVDDPGSVLPEPSPPPPISVPEPVVVDIEPVLVRRVTPEYPQIARAGGIEGEVLLLVTVSAEGTVTDVQVLRSAHRLLDDSARRAALQYEYTPGVRNVVPAEFQLELPVRFRLD